MSCKLGVDLGARWVPRVQLILSRGEGVIAINQVKFPLTVFEVIQYGSTALPIASFTTSKQTLCANYLQSADWLVLTIGISVDTCKLGRSIRRSIWYHNKSSRAR